MEGVARQWTKGQLILIYLLNHVLIYLLYVNNVLIYLLNHVLIWTYNLPIKPCNFHIKPSILPILNQVIIYLLDHVTICLLNHVIYLLNHVFYLLNHELQVNHELQCNNPLLIICITLHLTLYSIITPVIKVHRQIINPPLTTQGKPQ